jgi:hypothetical protein
VHGIIYPTKEIEMRIQARRYTERIQSDVVVLGGLNTTVEAEIEPADKSTGIMEAYPGEWSIIAINGRNVKPNESTSWLETRIKAEKQESIINEALFASLNDFEY